MGQYRFVCETSQALLVSGIKQYSKLDKVNEATKCTEAISSLLMVQKKEGIQIDDKDNGPDSGQFGKQQK